MVAGVRLAWGDQWVAERPEYPVDKQPPKPQPKPRFCGWKMPLFSLPTAAAMGTLSRLPTRGRRHPKPKTDEFRKKCEASGVGNSPLKIHGRNPHSTDSAGLRA